MKGHAFQVFLLGFVLITACNKEEYYGTSVAVEGQDAQCAAGSDVASCEALSGCQVAYEDVESVEPVFAACIANPPDEEVIIPKDPVNDPDPIIDPTDPDPVVVIDDPEEDPEDTVVPGKPGKKPSPDPIVDNGDDDEPTIDDAIANRCEGLDEKYYYSKVYSGKGQSHRVKKIKVCHHSAKDVHAIIVACPALNAHKKHTDYLGACKVE